MSATVRAAGEEKDPPDDHSLVSPYWKLDESDRALGLWQLIRGLPAATGPVLATIWRAAPRHAALIAVMQIVSGLATAFGLLATTGVFEELLAAGPTADRLTAALPSLGMVVGAVVLRGAVDTATAFALARVKPGVARLAEGEVFAASLRVDLSAFDDPTFYDRMHRARDQGLVHISMAVDTQLEMIGAAMAVVAASGGLLILHPALLPVLVVGVLPEGWAVLRSARLRYRYINSTVTMRRRIEMITDLAAERGSAAEIRSCQAQGFLLNEYGQLADPLRRQQVRVGMGEARTRAVGRALTGIATTVTFVALGVLLRAGWIPLAVAGTAVIAVRSVTGALGRLVLATNRLFEQSLYVADYQRLLDDASSRAPAAGGRAAPATPGRVTLENVSFCYPAERDDRAALRDINLTIEAGQTIALVGANGSGKTTLAKILAGLYPPTSGQIAWDGVDLAEFDPGSVADRIVMVMQNPVRWPHTARVNVRVGRHDRLDPGDRTLRTAATLAGADEVVAGLPDGWDSLLSRYFRGGLELSGGQWQRLAVARGLFRDAPLLIWDEPTAPLDAKAEFAVYESLRTLAHGRTVILITHRLASVRNADQICLLHQGELVERGTHDELMARTGRYAEMYELQARMHAPLLG